MQGEDEPIDLIENEVRDKLYLDFIQKHQKLYQVQPKMLNREYLSKYKEGDLKKSQVSNPFAIRAQTAADLMQPDFSSISGIGQRLAKKPFTSIE